MANHKSAKKRIRQTKKKNLNNKWKTSRLRTELKKIKSLIADGNKEQATELFPKIQAMFAKLAKTSAMKKSSAARKTSRIHSQIAKL